MRHKRFAIKLAGDESAVVVTIIINPLITKKGQLRIGQTLKFRNSGEQSLNVLRRDKPRQERLHLPVNIGRCLISRIKSPDS